MIVAVVEELPDVVLARDGEFDELGVDKWISSFAVVADGDAASVLGDVRNQDEELEHSQTGMVNKVAPMLNVA